MRPSSNPVGSFKKIISTLKEVKMTWREQRRLARCQEAADQIAKYGFRVMMIIRPLCGQEKVHKIFICAGADNWSRCISITNPGSRNATVQILIDDGRPLGTLGDKKVGVAVEVPFSKFIEKGRISIIQHLHFPDNTLSFQN